MLRAIINRHCSSSALKSSLGIVGAKAVSVARTIVPDIDPDSSFKHGIDDLRANFQARKLDEEKYIGKSLDMLLGDYQCWRNTQDYMSKLLLNRDNLMEKMRDEPPDSPELADLKVLFAEAKDQYKTKQRELWKDEEAFIVPYLSLPNVLDPDTPHNGEDLEIHSHLSKVASKSPLKRHADCPDVQTVEKANSKLVFLKNDLALKELDLCYAAQMALLKDEFCDIIASPDIVRSTVLEGCRPGSFGKAGVAFSLKECRDFKSLTSGLGAHLVGSASLPGMLTFFVKNTLSNSANLPLNYISIGRQYRPQRKLLGEKPTLFNTEQSTCVGLLSLNKNSEDLEQNFDKFIEAIKSFYNDLGLHFRLVKKKAEDLKLAESHRIDVHMWSPVMQKYVVVGSLSKYGDFLSRRLLLKYSDSDNKLQNYHIIGGTFIDTFKVIGCMLDTNK